MSAYNNGVTTRKFLNNTASNAADGVKGALFALGSFMQGLVKGEQQVKPAARRTTTKRKAGRK